MIKDSKILVVEDDPGISTPLVDRLQSQGYQVLLATTGQEGWELFQSESPHLVLLDLMLPEMDGLEVCRRIREESETPIIMITAKSDEEDLLRGFELGADDYVTKPFSLQELGARILAVLKRTSKGRDRGHLSGGIIDLGQVVIDLPGRVVRRGEETESLSNLESEVLEMLVENEGEAISRNRFLNEIWGYEVYPTTRTIDFHISRLRAKIEEDPSQPQHILTVHGVGYKFSR